MPVSNSNGSVGGTGESIAATYLKGQGFKIVECNFRCTCGEIDIVARDGRTIVFVEVKCRKNDNYGPPQLAVTPFKQRQISKAALVWLSRKKLYDAEARFDVVAIVLHEHDLPDIDHIRNAFDLAY
ncbi:YraN family protein [Geomonas azotofigens]|uniref:YraN family protein n=1 Tax=Geomonas azotofigens TaxID=2843196 RepID=UPI001C0FFA04|nr:YraN family protein [Geomonas azotofigens]MBU5615253.1 YraN family protein [Geomonas azotofigens]